VDAVAVEVVVEAQAACADADKARASLAAALAASRAPKRTQRGEHWTLTLVVSHAPDGDGRTTTRTRSADATIVDDAGAVVSQRTLADRDGHACAPLARAIGAWATLVVDAELTRAHDAAVPAGPDAASAPSDARTPTRTRTEGHGEPVANGPELGARPFAEIDDPDRAVATRASRTREIGVAGYLRGNGDGNGVTGLSPFVTIETFRDWMLRPALALGHSTTRQAFHGGARVDFCRRIPGNYVDHRGLEADVCGGADAGFIEDKGYATIGPAIGLRGDLGAGLVVEVRGSVGVNLLESSVAAAPRGSVASEAQLGISGALP
jgi:hypothetical protein